MHLLAIKDFLQPLVYRLQILLLENLDGLLISYSKLLCREFNFVGMVDQFL